MDLLAKINQIQQKIKDYKTKFPKRNWKQEQKLDCLWLELVFWQLVEKGEIKPPKYLAKVEKSWENLKEIYRKKSKWPRKKLKEFLKKQPKDYGKWLVCLIELEKNEKYLKFGEWLREWVRGKSKK